MYELLARDDRFEHLVEPTIPCIIRLANSQPTVTTEAATGDVDHAVDSQESDAPGVKLRGKRRAVDSESDMEVDVTPIAVKKKAQGVSINNRPFSLCSLWRKEMECKQRGGKVCKGSTSKEGEVIGLPRGC